MERFKKRIYTCFRNWFMLFPEPIIRKYEIYIEKILKRRYYSSECKSLLNLNKTIIAVVDDKINAGGLSDRINGMISSYKISKMLGYEFKICHNQPFNLEIFLIPNKYDWSISTNALSFNKNESTPIFIRALNHQDNNKRIQSFKKAIFSKEKISQYHCYSNLMLFSDSEFNRYFNYLFKPSKTLQQAIDLNTKNIGDKYISITFRFQQLLGDFNEGNFPILEESKRSSLINDCIAAVSNIASRHESHKILVTSDSITFLNIVGKMSNVYTIPGKLVHMAFTSDNSVETHLKSFVDLFMIANAEKIYLVTSDKLYNSGFPLLASKINSKPFEIIHIKTVGV